MNKLKKYNIYKITNLDNNNVYVGLTSQSIKKRFSSHKMKLSNTCMTKDFNFDNCILELLNEFYTSNLENARKLERQCIEKVRNSLVDGIVVNKTRPYISPDEKRAGQLRWRDTVGKQKIKCECGATICRREMARHVLTEKHKDFILGKSSLSSESLCQDTDHHHEN